MDRILILMAADNYADAQQALDSARQTARSPEKLSWGLCFMEEPDESEMADMARLGAVLFNCPAEDCWSCMPQLWSGESHVLMAHPTMRFTPGWDKALQDALRICIQDLTKRVKAEAASSDEEEALMDEGVAYRCALTGFLPTRDDPLKAVYPVAADRFDEEGLLHFHHGSPVRFASQPEMTAFLHPDFCFAPASFFRQLAEGDEPLFMRAFRHGWTLYTLHQPLMEVIWSPQVAPCFIPARHDLTGEFEQETGVSFAGRLLSPQARRGSLLTVEEQEKNQKVSVPLQMRWQERLRLWKRDGGEWLAELKADLKKQTYTRITPKCITLCTAGMEEDGLYWLRRHLAPLQDLHLMVYAAPQLVRTIAEFLPDVHEYQGRYGVDIPSEDVHAVAMLSKASLLAVTRNRFLTHSHYVWIDADCVRYSLYKGTVLEWKKICTDRIVMATIQGRPDPSLFVVPDRLVMNLAREFEARCLSLYTTRGGLPTESEIWQTIIREHPDWFELVPTAAKRQLFPRLTSLTE